ncbi:hypothetical protein AABB24_005986, partial [Solanum stoloniferum]
MGQTHASATVRFEGRRQRKRSRLLSVYVRLKSLEKINVVVAFHLIAVSVWKVALFWSLSADECCLWKFHVGSSFGQGFGPGQRLLGWSGWVLYCWLLVGYRIVRNWEW